MSIERIPSGNPDPEWEQLVAGYLNTPAPEPALHSAGAAAAHPGLPADPMGDTPLVPGWARTTGGWKGRTAVGRVNSTRHFRKWVRRQKTEHGHGAQTFRGMRRTFLWIQGTEGTQITAARHEVQQTQRDYKTAKWAHDRRLVPGKEKEKRRKDMEKSFAESVSAMSRYKAAQRDARLRRLARSAVALGPIAAAEGAGLSLLGGPGGLLAAGTTLLGFALLGRRTSAGELYTDRDAKVGDGDRMTDEMVNRVYRDARVIAADDVLSLVTPCTLTADGTAWAVVFDLPSGVPSKKAFGAADGIAGAFGVSVQQVSQRRGDREGRIRLRVALRMPFSGVTPQGPLLTAERINLWRDIPMGIDQRGEGVGVSWVERSGLFGGEPGSGKSAAANDLLLAAALDPTVSLYLADGKAGADITPFEPIATMFDTDGDPVQLLAILGHIWDVEIRERRALAKEHGSRKLTEAMAAVDPRVRLAVLLVDEWSSYGAAAPPKIREEMERLLRLIVQQGRALGIITLAATQKPDGDSVPTGIRDILSIRWAMRCLTPQASDTILGQGYAATGHNAQSILKSQRGVGILLSGEAAEPELVISHYYDDDEVATILRRAHALRQEAGTLPVTVEPEITILDHLIKAASSTGRGVVTRAELFGYLAGADEQYVRAEGESDSAYNARVGRALAAALDAEGVTVEAVKVPTDDGGRSMGYRLEDLNSAR